MSGTGKNAPDSAGRAHPAGYELDAWRDATAARLSGSTPAAITPLSHHDCDVEHWPMHETLVLGASQSAVPLARAHLRRLLAAWGRAELSPDASVVVSELMTNSVVASAELRPATAPVLVWLGSDGHCVLLTVADASPRPPVQLDLEADAEDGRGLALVEALSSRWGWHPIGTPGPMKKVVWAEWRLPSRAASGQRSA